MGMQETKPPNIHVHVPESAWTRKARSDPALLVETEYIAKGDDRPDGAQDDSMAHRAPGGRLKNCRAKRRERWLKLPFTGCDGLPKTAKRGPQRSPGRDRFCVSNTGMAIDMLFQAIQNGKRAPERALTVPLRSPHWIS